MLMIDLLVVPVGLESTVPRDPVTLLQLVPEGGEDPVEGMPDYEEGGRVLLTEHSPEGGVSQGGGHHPGLVIGLAGKYQILSD